jgi:hypothetical protein
MSHATQEWTKSNCLTGRGLTAEEVGIDGGGATEFLRTNGCVQSNYSNKMNLKVVSPPRNGSPEQAPVNPFAAALAGRIPNPSYRAQNATKRISGEAYAHHESFKMLGGFNSCRR